MILSEFFPQMFGPYLVCIGEEDGGRPRAWHAAGDPGRPVRIAKIHADDRAR